MTNALVPIVHAVDGAVYANSREVADFFGKEHRHVLPECRKLASFLSAENSVQWFVPSTYQARVGFGMKTLPAFNMTKDGFALLVMGFTGKAALLSAKARGTKLGGNRGVVMSDATREAGRATRTAKANERAGDLGPILAELRGAGIETLGGIARVLNERGIPTARGGQWSPMQVSRVVSKLEAKAGQGRRVLLTGPMRGGAGGGWSSRPGLSLSTVARAFR